MGAGMAIDAATAEHLLLCGIAQFEQGVERRVAVTITQGQFDALVSFAYNLGLRALENSTLLRRLNAGDWQGAADQFGRWVNAGGVRLDGLVAGARRNARCFCPDARIRLHNDSPQNDGDLARMIEDEIQRSLAALTHLAAYPLILPDSQQEGVTYQKISDLKVNTGLVDSSLVQSRFQIVLYVIDDYSRLIALDKAVLNAWEGVRHGHIGQWPVQAVTRSTLLQSATPLADNRVQYRMTRDYLITHSEVAV